MQSQIPIDSIQWIGDGNGEIAVSKLQVIILAPGTTTATSSTAPGSYTEILTTNANAQLMTTSSSTPQTNASMTAAVQLTTSTTTQATMGSEPVLITGVLGLSVADAQAFIAMSSNSQMVAQGIANSLSLPVNQVNVTLSLAGQSSISSGAGGISQARRVPDARSLSQTQTVLATYTVVGLLSPSQSQTVQAILGNTSLIGACIATATGIPVLSVQTISASTCVQLSTTTVGPVNATNSTMLKVTTRKPLAIASVAAETTVRTFLLIMVCVSMAS